MSSRASKAKPKPKPLSKKRSWWSLLGYSFVVGLVILIGYCVYLDAQIRDLFDGRKWSMPAKVYAQPMTLTNGYAIDEKQFHRYLERTGYVRTSGTQLTAANTGTYRQQGERWSIQRRGFQYIDQSLPAGEINLVLRRGEIQQLEFAQQERQTVILEPQYLGGILAQHSEDRELTRLEDVPAELVAALVLTEDRAFFQHYGVSLRGIARAMLSNIRAGKTVQGGSTLTQQLVKNFFLSSQRSLSRKINEALMALLLEVHYSKEEILETYINEVYFGQSGRRAIHGFELASRFLFGRPLAEVGLAEYATLVAMVKGPSYYNPRRNPERSLERRNLVLTLLANHGVINTEQLQQAQQQPLTLANKKRLQQQSYPAFLQLVKRQLQEDYSTTDLANAGLNIYTTLNPEYQMQLEASAQSHLANLEKGKPELDGQLQVAAVISDTNDGAIRAMLGGRNSRLYGFNRALDMRRSIGSLAKPAVFLTALNQPNYHWGSRVDDSPVLVEGPDDQIWSPRNYDRQSHGRVTLLEALSKSYNQATARLGMTVGLGDVVAEFRRLGVTEPLPEYPSLLLGSAELSPLIVTQMYQTMAGRGRYAPLRSIDAVATQYGDVLTAYSSPPEQRYDSQLMGWLEFGLREAVRSGTGRRIGRYYGDAIAGKTGTSNDQRDAWFAGYDQKRVGVIWVGRDDNQPTPFTGSQAALPIWKSTFSSIGVHELKHDAGLVMAKVNAQGQLVGKGCDGDNYPFPPARLEPAPRACGKWNQIDQQVKKWWQNIF